MKFKFILVLLVFKASVLTCQINIDSINNVINKSTEKNKPEIMLHAAMDIYPYNLTQAEKYVKKALDYYLKNYDLNGISKSYSTYGDIYLNVNKLEESLNYYKKALEIQKRNNDKAGAAYSLNSIGIIFYYQNDLDKSIAYFIEALKYAKNHSIVEEANALNSLGTVYRRKGVSDTSKEYYLKALQLLKNTNEKKILAKTYQNLGLLNYEISDFEAAIESYKNAETLYSEINDTKGKGIVLNNIGNVYYSWGNFENAASSYQKSLKIFEEINFDNGIGSSLTNLGNTYIKLKDFASAQEYLEKALIERKKLGYKKDIANAYLNLANLHSQINNEENIKKYGEYWEKEILKHQTSEKILQQYKKSIEYNEEALKISNEIGDKRSIATCYNNIGTVYSLAGNVNKALNYYQKALSINKEMGNQSDEVVNLLAIGIIYSFVNDYSNAQKYLNDALKLAKELQKKETEKDIYYNLALLHENIGNCLKALSYYKTYTNLKDTLLNKDIYKQIAELKTKYETEKKQKEIELLNKDKKLKENQIKQQRMAIAFFIIITVVITILIFVLIKQNKQRKLTNIALAQKNKLITEQKQEITDSIMYASRIQKAILPPEETLNEIISSYFILYLPRDIVSGDFYYINKYDSKIIVAAVDCTGHGVPGAFMSMLGMTLLQETINETKELRANIILNELRERLLKSLHQSKMNISTRDGMDMSLYVFDTETLSLSYAGANNPLIIIHNNEIVELKADKMPIGVYEKMDNLFNENVFTLNKGDMLYTYSDGYQDQFGGLEGKKFMSKRLKELLLSISQLPLDIQHNKLKDNFYEWKGENAQIDDVLVIGVRV